MKVTHEGATLEELGAIQVSGSTEIRFYVDRTLSASEITSMEQQMISKGIVLLGHIVQEGRIISVRFQK